VIVTAEHILADYRLSLLSYRAACEAAESNPSMLNRLAESRWSTRLDELREFAAELDAARNVDEDACIVDQLDSIDQETL
jgi:hypothetical protein